MTVQETIDLIKALKEAGVANFKHGDLELSFSSTEIQMAPRIPLEAPSEPSPEIKHVIEEFTSIMKMGDMELLDRLFPEPTLEEESA